MRYFRLAASLAICCVVGAGPGLAQEEVCRNPQTRQVDPQATANWRRVSAQADQMLMQRFVGVWNQEIVSQATNQVAYSQYYFESNGLLQIRQRVCNQITNMCSDYQGFGQFTVMRQDAEAFYGMIMASDTRRDHVCTSLVGRFADDYTILGANGGTMQRVQ
jgi:hypothetical protein